MPTLEKIVDELGALRLEQERINIKIEEARVALMMFIKPGDVVRGAVFTATIEDRTRRHIPVKEAELILDKFKFHSVVQIVTAKALCFQMKGHGDKTLYAIAQAERKLN